MLYYLFEYLESIDFPGSRMFGYLSFRSVLSVVSALIISAFVGRRIIRILENKQIGDSVRELGLEGQSQKKGTPTMGGIIVLISVLVPTLLFTRLDNIYILLMIITTVWLGMIGFVDDYIKVFLKDKEGLAARFKVLGQVLLGVIVAGVLCFSDDAVIREYVVDEEGEVRTEVVMDSETGQAMLRKVTQDVISTKTTIPFVKSHEFDYGWLVRFLGKDGSRGWWSYLIYTIAIIFIIVAVSNGANLTDGLDGLATGTSAISGLTLGFFAYLSGHIIYSGYLNIMYIPNAGELTVFMSAFVGASIGFLWYNSYPAQVFMGDTGSLSMGGIIAVFAVVIRKEILLPLLCGVFLVETVSVMLQVGYFKYTKRRFGDGRRVFLMAPLHHHFQKKGVPEAKIVTRFWIIGIILAMLTVATFKMR